MTKKTIYDFDEDFNHYELDTSERKKKGQVWTPYKVIVDMMNKSGSVRSKTWTDENKTMLDPTMGAGNIIISMLYRRIVECHQNPIKALSNTYGIEIDKSTHKYAQKRIKKFMLNFTKSTKLDAIIKHNFVCSDFFEWDLENWKKKK